MAKPAIDFGDLPPEVQAKVRKVHRVRRAGAFTKDQVRSHALRVLALLADLSQDQRGRVLRHAVKVNEV